MTTEISRSAPSPLPRKLAVYLGGQPTEKTLHVSAFEHGVSTQSFAFDRVYCVDAGISQLPSQLRVHEKIAWVGDLDSCGPEGWAAFQKLLLKDGAKATRVAYSTEKDFSDFAGALSLITETYDCSSSLPLFLEIYAGTGGRKDHEYINILEATRFLSQRNAKTVCVFHPDIILTNCAIELEVDLKTTFSVVSPVLCPSICVHITGCRYSGFLTLTRPSHGLSNEAVAPTITIAPLHHEIVAVLL